MHPVFFGISAAYSAEILLTVRRQQAVHISLVTVGYEDGFITRTIYFVGRNH